MRKYTITYGLICFLRLKKAKIITKLLKVKVKKINKSLKSWIYDYPHRGRCSTGKWKIDILVFMTILMFFNVLTIIMWVNSFGEISKLYRIPNIELNIFPDAGLNSLVSVISVLFPLFILNYFSMIHNDRYKQIITKDPYKNLQICKNGRIFLSYMFITIALLSIPIIIHIFKYGMR